VIFLSSEEPEDASALGLSVFGSGVDDVGDFDAFFLAGLFCAASCGSVSAGAAAASVKSEEISERVCDKFPVSWANLCVDEIVVMVNFLHFRVVKFQWDVELLRLLDLLDHSLGELVTIDPDFLAVRQELKPHVHAIGTIHDAVVVQKRREVEMRCDRKAAGDIRHAAVVPYPLRILLLVALVRGADVNQFHVLIPF